MKMPPFLTVVALLAGFGAVTSRAESLSPADMSGLLEDLSAHPLETWIDHGRIHGRIVEESWPRYDYGEAEIDARIQEETDRLRSSAAHPFTGDELLLDRLQATPYNVRYAHRASTRKEETFRVVKDGARFSWERDLRAFEDLAALRDDPLVPYYLSPADESYFARSTPPTHASERFDAEANQRTVVTWGPGEYRFYNASPNGRIDHLMREATPVCPTTWPQPLIAGLIPWGHGLYGGAALAALDVRGTRYTDVRGAHTSLTLQGDGLRVSATLLAKADPEGRPAYALEACEIVKGDAVVATAVLGGHVWFEGHWVPTQIMTERSKRRHGAERTVRTTLLLELESLEGEGPRPLETHADMWVRYDAPGLTQPLRYQVCEGLDTEALLRERLALARTERPVSLFAATSPALRRNCATLSLDWAARRLGVSLPERKLSALVDDAGTSAIADLARVARDGGLRCRVVRGPLNALDALDDAVVLLYLPQKRHVVVLGSVDPYRVWLIDLQRQTFLYARDRSTFAPDWRGGAALILSRNPLSLADPIQALAEAEIVPLRGGRVFNCQKLVQDGDIYDIPCPIYPPCDGYAEDYNQIYGCEQASHGSCTIFTDWSLMEADCLLDPYNPGKCTTSDFTIIYYDQACY